MYSRYSICISNYGSNNHMLLLNLVISVGNKLCGYNVVAVGYMKPQVLNLILNVMCL